MIPRISNTIILFLKKYQAIDGQNEKEVAIYKYGVELCVASIINILLIILIGALTHTIPDCLLFLILFIPIRQCTGGYHAETYLVCNIILAITYITVIFGITYLPEHLFLQIFLWFLSFAVICIYAPCENKHKKISAQKRKKFKWLCRILWPTVGAVALCLPSQAYDIKMNIILTMSMISMLIVLDIIFKKEEKKNG